MSPEGRYVEVDGVPLYTHGGFLVVRLGCTRLPVMVYNVSESLSKTQQYQRKGGMGENTPFIIQCR